MIQDDKTSSKWVHFQPFWFPKVSIFKPKIFVSKLRISQKILTPTHLGNADLAIQWKPRSIVTHRVRFAIVIGAEDFSQILPKKFPRRMLRMLVVDRWLHFPKSLVKTWFRQENQRLFGIQWTVEPYWNLYGFQLVIFTLFWQIDILKK